MVPLRVSVNRTSSGQRNSPCAGTQVEGPPICPKNTGLIAGSLSVCTDSSPLSLSTGMLGVDCVSPVGDVAQTVAEFGNGWPEWQPQSAVSNRRIALGATGPEASILSSDPTNGYFAGEYRVSSAVSSSPPSGAGTPPSRIALLFTSCP